MQFGVCQPFRSSLRDWCRKLDGRELAYLWPPSSRASVNTTAKNKFHAANTHPSRSQQKVRKSAATKHITHSFWGLCMHAAGHSPTSYLQHTFTQAARVFAVLATNAHALPLRDQRRLNYRRIPSCRTHSPPSNLTLTYVKWRHFQIKSISRRKKLST